ncbi:MAG: hypothetical protein ABW133_02480, partial [Polyangiaceae bacterium]
MQIRCNVCSTIVTLGDDVARALAKRGGSVPCRNCKKAILVTIASDEARESAPDEPTGILAVPGGPRPAPPPRAMGQAPAAPPPKPGPAAPSARTTGTNVTAQRPAPPAPAAPSARTTGTGVLVQPVRSTGVST